jgi:hypothetical protein
MALTLEKQTPSGSLAQRFVIEELAVLFYQELLPSVHLGRRAYSQPDRNTVYLDQVLEKT